MEQENHPTTSRAAWRTGAIAALAVATGAFGVSQASGQESSNSASSAAPTTEWVQQTTPYGTPDAQERPDRDGDGRDCPKDGGGSGSSSSSSGSAAPAAPAAPSDREL